MKVFIPPTHLVFKRSHMLGWKLIHKTNEGAILNFLQKQSSVDVITERFRCQGLVGNLTGYYHL